MRRSLIIAAVGSITLIALFGAMTASGSVFDHSEHLPEVLQEDPGPPVPYYVPPDPPDTEQQLPDHGLQSPPFPFLPDEDRHASRSVGTVTEGYLANARRIPLPHPHLEFLPRQYKRGFHYTSDPMFELVGDAAEHVADIAPDRPVHLGNFSRRGGGNIPQSVSHNSGRDADIAFFVRDEQGEPTRPPDLLPMDEDGIYDAADDEDADDDDLVLQFDTELNWRFVEGLIESDAADLKYIFVSNPLRDKLLDHARDSGAAATTIRLAEQILIQPGGGALPHDDHFHLRIHCTDRDLASGCVERGRPGPTYSPDESRVSRVVQQAVSLLDDEDPTWRRKAIDRLSLIPDHGYDERIVERIDDPDPRVRISAARALEDYGHSTDTLANQLMHEEHPAVFAELADTLANHSGGEATTALIDALTRDDYIALGEVSRVPTAQLTADALARQHNPDAVEPLIDALDDVAPSVRPQVVHALRMLTNHRLVADDRLGDDEFTDEVTLAWQTWWDEYGDQSQSEWIAAGFGDAGFDIDDLDEGDVWELTRAISSTRHLNVNAQRILEEIAGETHDSYNWDPYDANFFWRRWFENRKDQFSVPPIPEELSTADGYQPPD